jgi:hypothetical protein
MTKQELNRDIKRLFKKFHDWMMQEHTDWDKCEELKKEFNRLYNADQQFEYISRENILRLVILNRRHRIIPFHQFGTGINEETL